MPCHRQWSSHFTDFLKLHVHVQEMGTWKVWIEPDGDVKPRRALVPHSGVRTVEDLHNQLKEAIVSVCTYP